MSASAPLMEAKRTSISDCRTVVDLWVHTRGRSSQVRQAGGGNHQRSAVSCNEHRGPPAPWTCL